jgi:hypothetical protein
MIPGANGPERQDRRFSPPRWTWKLILLAVLAPVLIVVIGIRIFPTPSASFCTAAKSIVAHDDALYGVTSRSQFTQYLIKSASLLDALASAEPPSSARANRIVARDYLALDKDKLYYDYVVKSSSSSVAKLVNDPAYEKYLRDDNSTKLTAGLPPRTTTCR